MSKICPVPHREFYNPSIDEQFDFVQPLWGLIATTSEQFPVSEWHREIIRERLAAYHVSPSAGRFQTDVRTDIEPKLCDR